ncbi:MAG: hypothetical protein AB7C97_09545 [Oscillospiraceae bacterium]
MLEVFKDIAITLILAGVCAIGAYTLKTRKQQILAIAAELIQKAENAIQGSGMGEEKKTLVITQLEAMGITVDTWLSGQIDSIVKYLNTKSGWLSDSAADTAKTAVASVTGESETAE